MECGHERAASTSCIAARLIIVLSLCALALAMPGVSQAGIDVWTSHGPYGGNVLALAIDPTTPSTLYAGTDGGGVFQSTNSGGSWSAVNTGLSAGFGVQRSH